jgi:hypothetical protein
MLAMGTLRQLFAEADQTEGHFHSFALGRRAERCSRIVEKARIEPKRFTDLSRSRGSRTRGRYTGSRCPRARRRTRAAA